MKNFIYQKKKKRFHIYLSTKFNNNLTIDFMYSLFLLKYFKANSKDNASLYSRVVQQKHAGPIMPSLPNINQYEAI